MARPDFFIIGAPKCGTTALSEYLRQHPKIGFSTPKEPIYFALDFPKARNFTEEGEYLGKCFGHCRGQGYLAIGEGSTAYFFSEYAVPNILEFEPDAKIIVMLRNPVDMIHALHGQKLLSLEDDVADFETAWALQEKRARGESLPRFCLEPALLQYARLGKLGSHLQRIFSQVPERQRKVLLFDDFQKDTRWVYLVVLEFLGVPPDDRVEFPRINESRKFLLHRLYEFSHRPPERLVKWAFLVRDALGIERLDILSRLQKWNVKPARRKPLSPDMRKTLVAEFSDDIDLLSELLHRDLSHWKQ